MLRNLFALALTTLVTFCGFRVHAEETAKIIEVKKIWDQAPHNAFTDLVRFHDRWFCVFREGQGHVSPDGALRVITSSDGENWESATLIQSPHSDLRDAKITVTPDGQLMLSGAEALHDTSVASHQSLAWFSRDGYTWTEKHEIGDPNFWLWRVTWHKDTAYGIGYGCGDEKSIRLYSSKDGRTFETLVECLTDVGYPNETSIVFVDDTAYCLLRRDGNPSSGMLGIAKPPFTTWEWKDLQTTIGGPHMIRLPDGRFVAAVRLYDNKVRTSLCWVDPQAGSITEFLALPSGGDTSYAGMVLHNDLLWVSYYSSHEGKTSIYLAKVEIAAASKAAEKPGMAAQESVCNIGSRRELFVDDFLIEKQQGVELLMHRPVARDVALICNEPWEGNTSAYYTLFEDGGRFRMFYRGAHFDVTTKKEAHPEFTCYAESKDGIHWEKPKLGLFEFNGSKENNIIWAGEDTHNFTPFRDTNPNCPEDARYKALAGGSVRWGGKGLRAYQSPDGIHWSLMSDAGVLTDGDFDSQNLAFWHPQRECYITFYRKSRDGVRDIMTATSTDFIHWTEPGFLEYGDSPKEHLYTNAIQLYARAPHLYLGFPTRFQPSHEQVEPILMTSRDGLNFRRWPEPLIPITAPKDRDGNRSNYMTSGLLQLPGEDREVSVYATEAYYEGPGSRVRRFTFRTDGFVSLHAGAEIGEVFTRPFTFDGGSLVINFATNPGGSVKVEIQDAAGKPLPGYALADCKPLAGDSIEQPVQWTGGDVTTLSGGPVRLRFVMQDADVYSLKFVP
jgi:hypothetical protein